MHLYYLGLRTKVVQQYKQNSEQTEPLNSTLVLSVNSLIFIYLTGGSYANS